MHQNKAEALRALAEVSRELDTEMNNLKDAVRHPHRVGWRASVSALAALPFLGAAAVLTDATDTILRKISDSRWGDAPQGGSAAPPYGEL